MDEERPPRRLDAWLWPAGLALLLLAMIGGSVTFYFIAAANRDAPVVADAYAAGLRYNEQMALERRASQLGWDVGLRTTPTDEGVLLELDVRDERHRRLDVERAVVRRVHPTQGGFDADFDLEPGPQGGARAAIPLPLRGRWRLVATVDAEGRTVREATEVRAP